MRYILRMTKLPRQERPLHWVGSSKRDLMAFPEDAIDDFGYGLGVVQLGGQPPSAKPWKGDGPGVYELVEDVRGDTYRVAYTVRFAKAVYVLYFQPTPLLALEARRGGRKGGYRAAAKLRKTR